ncbi:MAG: hypothetical protein ABGY42_07520, partial [bacterium]
MERWKALAVLAVAGALLHFFGTNIADPDIWGHLRYGTSMWQGGGLPWVDTYSYTASGAVFYDHEWLSDFFFAGLWWAAGSPGLIVAKLFFGLLIVVLLRDAGATLGRTWYPKFRAHPLPEALVLVLALSVIAPGATFRPQLWTMLLLAAQLAVLARAEARLRGTAYRGRVGWEAGVQPLLIAFWANLHGGFLVGVAVFGLFVGSVLVRALCGLFPARLRPREGLAVAGLGLFALAAPVLNPYGTDLYAYLWRTLGDHGAIGEWNAVALGDPNFFRFQALVLLTLSGAFFLARRRRLPIAELAMGWWLPLLALLAVYSYRHQRHTVLFAEAAVPFLLVSGDRARCLLLRRWPVLRPTPLLRRAVFCALVLIAGMQIGGFSRTLARDGATIRVD